MGSMPLQGTANFLQNMWGSAQVVLAWLGEYNAQFFANMTPLWAFIFAWTVFGLALMLLSQFRLMYGQVLLYKERKNKKAYLRVRAQGRAVLHANPFGAQGAHRQTGAPAANPLGAQVGSARAGRGEESRLK